MADAGALARAVERVWWGAGTGARAARAALAPAEAAYRGVVAARGALYDRGVLPVHPLALPAVSVGNLTVGGTGKTPVAAWIAAELRARGARPAIVLRGYGADEPLVHAALNPAVLVVAAADRVAGALSARQRGADVVVLDDAFQHRRAGRVADLVLVSADSWDGRARLLPVGPWREPLDALRRATLLVVTRKAASAEQAAAVVAALAAVAPQVPAAVVHLSPGPLHAVLDDAELPLARLCGARVLAVSAIGDPRAFVGQMRAAGAHVDEASFRDHHPFTARDVERLLDRAARADRVVCTLKDAVKLRQLWPRAAVALWYVSQRVSVERGAPDVDGALDAVLAARSL